MKSGAEASYHRVHYVCQCLAASSSWGSSSLTSLNEMHGQSHAYGVGGAPSALHSGMCTDWRVCMFGKLKIGAMAPGRICTA